MIRDRFALATAGLSAAGLSTLAALAMGEPVRRQIDVTVLWLAAAATLGLVVTWVFVPRLPKFIVAGWGLILIALGVGELIAAPVPAGAGEFPWALIGCVVFGLVTIVTAVVHSGSGSTSH
jgi:hypothetical protein